MRAIRGILTAAFLTLASDSGVLVAASPGSVLWTCDEGTTISSSPAVASDGTVYVGTAVGLCAVTNSNGVASNKWVFGAAITSSSPAIGDDGTIYVCSSDGNIYAVAPDGTRKWSFQAQAGGGSVAIGADGTLYLEGASYLYAITSSGTLKWKSSVAVAGNFSSPVVGADGSIYITSPNNNAIYAFSPDGRQKWVTGGTSTVADSPAISVDGKIFVTAGPLYALGPDGTQLWYTTGFFAGASPILGADGTVYVRNSDDRLLYALSSGGQALWEAAMEPARYAPSTAPAIGGQGTAYYCASNSLTALNSVGAVQWTVFGGTPSLPGSWYANTSPAIGTDGTVYAALGSKLYAVAGTSALANSSWPMYRQNARHTGRIEKTLLSQPQKRADANVEFQLYPHQVGLTFTIESSSNLGSWSSLTSFVAMTLPMPVVDLTASNFPVRFYRAFSAQ